MSSRGDWRAQLLKSWLVPPKTLVPLFHVGRMFKAHSWCPWRYMGDIYSKYTNSLLHSGLNASTQRLQIICGLIYILRRELKAVHPLCLMSKTRVGFSTLAHCVMPIYCAHSWYGCNTTNSLKCQSLKNAPKCHSMSPVVRICPQKLTCMLVIRRDNMEHGIRFFES